MENEWNAIETVNVHANRRIRLPSKVKENVVFEDRFHGDSVYWNHDTESNTIIVAKEELQDDRYISTGFSQLHNQQNTVTPPKELVDLLREEIEQEVFEKGSTAVYLAHEAMLDGDPVTFYVLSEQRLYSMLDENTDYGIVQLLKSAKPA